ncbi:hypothetical protein ACS0TY_019787 [Phlomoides rotata]
MVSVHPNPPPGQGIAHFYTNHFGGDPISIPAMNPRYALGPQSMPLPGNIVGSAPVYTLIPSTMLTDCESPLSKDEFASSGTMTHNWSSNCNEIAPHVWTSNEANHLVNENLNEKRDLFLVSINLIC